MPHAGHRVSFGFGAALLAVLMSLAAPAAAEPGRSQLGVGARVRPSCEATTEGAAAAPTCTAGAEATISVEQGRSARYPDPSAASGAPDHRDSTLTWVTITY